MAMVRAAPKVTIAEIKAQCGYMVEGYTEAMGHGVIPDELVIKPMNGVYWTDADPPMKVLSRDRGPTYGTCSSCCGSGPVGMYCQICRNEYCKYRVVRIMHGACINSEWIAKIAGATHLRDRVDRKISWLSTPTMTPGPWLDVVSGKLECFRPDHWVG